MRLSICAVALCLLFSGCATMFTKCEPSDINRIIIHVDTNKTLISGAGLQGNYQDSLKEVIQNSAIREIQAHRKDTNIVLTSTGECDNHSVLVESKLLSLSFDTFGFGRKPIYTGILDIQIKDCGTKNVIATGDMEKTEDAVIQTAKKLGEDLGHFVVKKVPACK